MKPKIQNVVATAALNQRVDAPKFVKFSWGRYDVEYYGGRCGYVKDEKIRGRVSVFLSGKMISIGAKSVTESVQQLEHAMKLLVDNKFVNSVRLQPVVQNIVATLEFDNIVDLKLLVRTLPNFIYEPDQFPGLIYKSSCGPKCLIFSTGKVVIAGQKSEDSLNATASEIDCILKSLI